MPGSKTPSLSSFSSFTSLISGFSGFSRFSFSFSFSLSLSFSFSLSLNSLPSFQRLLRPSKSSFCQSLPSQKSLPVPPTCPRRVARSRTRSSLSGVSDFSRDPGRSAWETKGWFEVLSELLAIVVLSWLNGRRSSHGTADLKPAGGGRAVEQVGERRADRLAGVALVVDEARAGVHLEADVLAVRHLLEVDPGEEEVEISGGAETGGLDRGGQGGGLHGDVEPVEVGVAVVHRFGLDAGGEDPVADGMHPNVAPGHEGLELRRA